jgi:putative ABC transport system ATP-binding protein
MDNSPVIRINSLVRKFPMGSSEFTAINGIVLTISRGEFAGLIGPSGSGKTTLLNIIGSLDVPTSGDVDILGKSVGSLTAKEAAKLRKESIGFIFQTFNLFAVYTVYENVEFPLLLLGYSYQKRRRMVMDALGWVGLKEKAGSRPSQLSGGECQRVAIARAMVKRPIVVLADEPTANLDAANSHNILKTMWKLNADLKTTFLFATHDDKVISYLKRKISLVDGKIVSDIIVPDR